MMNMPWMSEEPQGKAATVDRRWHPWVSPGSSMGSLEKQGRDIFTAAGI